MHQYNRREFIGAAALGTAALMAGTIRSFGQNSRKIPIGVQLYSVRTTISNDVPGTLAGIKKIGYEGVEFAGYFDLSASDLKKMLDDNGLKCCGTHIGLQTMQGDELEKTIEFNRTIGNDKLIVPSLRANSLEDWANHAASFSEVAEKLKPHNMHIGFHNHYNEFQEMEGEVQLDYFFSKASPDVKVQLDIGHCAHGGADPAAYLKKYAGRVVSVHTKDWDENNGANDVVGEGIVKWAEVIPACQATGVQWHIVEEESNAFEGLDGIEKSYQNLVNLTA